MKVKSLESRVKSQTPWVALRSNSDSRPSTLDPRPARRGMTLIELLVVIVIITTLVAAAIPLISPSNDDRRLREAARGLNTFISGASSRAIGLRRPYGVAIKRVAQDTNKNGGKNDDRAVSAEVFYVEQPAPYTGFDANSRACVAFDPATAGNVLIRFITRGTTSGGLPPGWTTDAFPSSFLRPGDVVQINGTQFELLSSTSPSNVDVNGFFNSVNQLRARPLNDSGQQINPLYDNSGAEIGTNGTANRPYWTSPSTYKVLRQPTPTSDQPYQLPEGTGIDLRASGVGRDNYFYVQGINDNDQGILIMFAPSGRVARVTYSQSPNSASLFDQPVVDNIYLLVGRRDRIPPAAANDPTKQAVALNGAVTDDQRARLREPINWLNGSSHWIAIASQTGRIATIENGNVGMSTLLAIANLPASTPLEHEKNRNEQILAAREFTREMGQVGGR
jgi:prepilin-type N-terminal cleavage/methylation domain-containing protein